MDYDYLSSLYEELGKLVHRYAADVDFNSEELGIIDLTEMDLILEYNELQNKIARVLSDEE